MANKTSEELVSFLDGLEEFLENSNPNLGRKSARRAEFINTIMNKVRDFVGDPEAEKEETQEDKRSRIRERRTAPMKDNVLRMEPNEQIRKAANSEKGCAVMTKEASMQADEELGNVPNMTEEK